VNGQLTATPHTTVVLAMSLDGKIADRDRTAARFSSPADLAHLETQVAQADGVLFGAGTLRAYGTCLSVRQSDLCQARAARGQAPQPVQMVGSASGRLDATMKFFQQPVPRWLLTTPTGAGRWPDVSPFHHILPLLGESETDWRAVAQALYQQGIHRLALLGGGSLVAAWVEADLVDDWWVTVCPLVLGGRQAPTLCDGEGWPAALVPGLQLLSAQAQGQEVFLHYRRQRED
jgi:5-amino-6-(5-phosphoribosylamino)uracil reductase